MLAPPTPTPSMYQVLDIPQCISPGDNYRWTEDGREASVGSPRPLQPRISSFGTSAALASDVGGNATRSKQIFATQHFDQALKLNVSRRHSASLKIRRPRTPKSIRLGGITADDPPPAPSWGPGGRRRRRSAERPPQQSPLAGLST